MRVLTLALPGRFPAVVFDPGRWWDAVAATRRHELEVFSANYAWWRTMCSARIKQLMLSRRGALERLHQQARLWSRNSDLEAIAAAAGGALDALTTHAPYQSIPAYLKTLAPIAQYLDAFNEMQSELFVDVKIGPLVHGLDYDSSAALVRYSQADSLLSRSIEAALEQCPGALGFAALTATSPQDLLTGLIAARHLRNSNPGVHISLVDHGYENFSLHAHIDALRHAGTLDAVFDTIIAQKDDRDSLVPALIEAVAAGDHPRGYLTSADLPAVAIAPTPFSAPPPAPTFTPEAVLLTRLSKRRCYWNKCNYCTQNSKYADTRAPSDAEIRASLDRIETLVAAGYRYFLFADEAISPSTLRLLADEIDRRGTRFHWSCRCKLERAHTAELFERVAKAGCYEILYGLESTSPRVLSLMGKYTEGLDEERIGKVFAEMAAVGIQAYIALIGGFPGDTLADTGNTVDFLIRESSNLRGATYFVNTFIVYCDTPVAREPNRFGIAKAVAKGDIAQKFEYQLAPEIRDATGEVIRELPALRRRLDDAFGWTPLLQRPGGEIARWLYFTTGQGAIFRTLQNNPFTELTQDSRIMQTGGPASSLIVRADAGEMVGAQ